MNSNFIIIILSCLVISSYLFDIVAKKIKVPSVLLLIASGVLLNYFSSSFGIPSLDLSKALPIIGTIGLIMIVLEGALEIKFSQENKKLIVKAFWSALIILITTNAAITWLIHSLTEADWHKSFLNAVPFSIVSSAIAIPSVANLSKEKKEFIIYESSLSDVLGIILFNFALENENVGISSFLQLGWDVILISIISILSCLLLLYLMGRIKNHIKFFLILSILVFIYGVGKSFHLPTLIIILVFGLFLNNVELIHFEKFHEKFHYPKIRLDLKQLHILTAETAFLIRTFFFLIFGYTIDISSLFSLEVFYYSLGFIVIIYSLRLIYLVFVLKDRLFPELFIVPRGLISILLFLAIPSQYLIPSINNNVMLAVILTTSSMMMLGFAFSKTEKISTDVSPYLSEAFLDEKE